MPVLVHRSTATIRRSAASAFSCASPSSSTASAPTPRSSPTRASRWGRSNPGALPPAGRSRPVSSRVAAPCCLPGPGPPLRRPFPPFAEGALGKGGRSRHPLAPDLAVAAPCCLPAPAPRSAVHYRLLLMVLRASASALPSPRISARLRHGLLLVSIPPQGHPHLHYSASGERRRGRSGAAGHLSEDGSPWHPAGGKPPALTRGLLTGSRTGGGAHPGRLVRTRSDSRSPVPALDRATLLLYP